MLEYATKREKSKHMFARSVLKFMSGMFPILHKNYSESFYMFILNQFQWSGFATHVFHRADRKSNSDSSQPAEGAYLRHIVAVLHLSFRMIHCSSFVNHISNKKPLMVQIGVAHFIKRRLRHCHDNGMNCIIHALSQPFEFHEGNTNN